MRPTITNGCTAINQTNKLAEEQKSKNALYTKMHTTVKNATLRLWLFTPTHQCFNKNINISSPIKSQSKLDVFHPPELRHKHNVCHLRLW